MCYYLAKVGMYMSAEWKSVFQQRINHALHLAIPLSLNPVIFDHVEICALVDTPHV